MKTNIKALQDCFKMAYEAYSDSYRENMTVQDMYHNRHYNSHQLDKLDSRGQPAETFNLVKTYDRKLIGYYSTVINRIKIEPRQNTDIYTAMTLHDLMDYTLHDNNFEVAGDRFKVRPHEIWSNGYGIQCSQH